MTIEKAQGYFGFKIGLLWFEPQFYAQGTPAGVTVEWGPPELGPPGPQFTSKMGPPGPILPGEWGPGGPIRGAPFVRMGPPGGALLYR